jgi:branched-chain amino acid transport system permease protein
VAAYITFQLVQWFDWDPFLTMVFTGPLFFGLGWLIYRMLIARLGTQAGASSTVLTFGLGVVLEVLIILTWATNFRSITPPYGTDTLVLGSVRLAYPRLIGLGLSILLLLLLQFFLKFTKVGKSIRAIVQDPEAAMYVGVDIRRVCALTFAIAMASVAVGGVLLGTIYAFYPAVHLQWIGRLFAIVVLGGMGSVSGTFLGAYIVAMAESLVTLYIGAAWAPLVGFLVILGVLLLRPTGLRGPGALARA